MIGYIICVVVIFLILNSIIFFKNRVRAYNINGPLPLPFIGNCHNLLHIKANAFLQLLRSYKEKYGDVYLLHLCSQAYIMMHHPKHVEELLSSTEHIKKGKSYQYLRPWLGDGLLTTTGNKWKTHRKLLTPAFHFNILQGFLPVFLKNEKILNSKLREIADGKPIDIFPLIALHALDNVTESIMGVSMNAQLNSESEYVKSIEAISSLLSLKMRNPLFRLDFILKLTSYKKIQDKALKILHDQTKKVIELRINELKSNDLSLQENNEFGIKNKYTFLDLLLLSKIDGQSIKKEDIQEEVDTFMFEGHDTTSSGIVFALYCISQNVGVQEKIMDEQKLILGEDWTRDPSYTELQQMKYLEMVIRESLRLYPSVPLIERMISNDCEISGLTILKNTSIIVNIFELQRHPDLYEDPLEFRPERFQDKSRDAFNWLAFSAGPRNCIGQKFAMLEMKVTVASIIKNFNLIPVEEKFSLCGDLILKSDVGVKVAFTRK